MKELRSIENVKEVFIVYGVYDIIARIEGQTMEKVKKRLRGRYAGWTGCVVPSR